MSTPDARILAGELDPFLVLGLDYFATDADVRKSFRNLARVLHPDKVRQVGIGVVSDL